MKKKPSLEEQIERVIRARELYLSGIHVPNQLAKAMDIDFNAAKKYISLVKKDLIKAAKDFDYNQKRQEIDEQLCAELLKIDEHIKLCKSTIKVLSIDNKPYEYPAPAVSSIASFVKTRVEIIEKRARLWGIISSDGVHVNVNANASAKAEAKFEKVDDKDLINATESVLGRVSSTN